MKKMQVRNLAMVLRQYQSITIIKEFIFIIYILAILKQNETINDAGRDINFIEY